MSISSKPNPDYTVLVLLESSEKVQALEKENAELKQLLTESEAKQKEFYNRLINEMSRGLRLDDELRELKDAIRNR